METLFETPVFRTFVLQDAKRLPARFFAWISGIRSAGAQPAA